MCLRSTEPPLLPNPCYKPIFYLSSSFSIRFPIVISFISCSKFLNSVFWNDLICSPFLKRCISSQVSLRVEKICDEITTILFSSFSFKIISVNMILLWISTPLKGSSRIKYSFSWRRIAVIANFFFIPVEYVDAYWLSGKSKIFLLSNSKLVLPRALQSSLMYSLPVIFEKKKGSVKSKPKWFFKGVMSEIISPL